MTWAPGQVIAGRYRLVDQLGRGGMGAVWRAEHISLKTMVAVKQIDAQLAVSADALARFNREAQSAASLRSTHVVQILDHGVEDHVPYIAMELLQGESLGGRMERLGRLDPAMIVEIITQMARAVGKAHEAGIIHRDLKPDNVFLVQEDDRFVVKVLDFGIAKRTGEALAQSNSGSTRTGAILGTPYYMSPEQARGVKAVDHRSDLWAMGVITYECLLGRRPFDSDALGDLLLKICSEAVPVPSQVGPVPPAFDAWFLRAMARDPADRFGSARELADSLRAALTGVEMVALLQSSDAVRAPARTPLGLSTGAISASEMPPAIPTHGRGGLLFGALALVAGLLAAGGWFALRRTTPAREPTETATTAEAVTTHATAPVAPPAATEQAATPTTSVTPAIAAPEAAAAAVAARRTSEPARTSRTTKKAEPTTPAPAPTPAKRGADLFTGRQ